MTQIFYRQCVFKQGDKVQTAWIEERGAKVGARVTFKDAPDDAGLWEVESVGEERMPEKRAKEFERAYLHHRECSDI